MKLSFILIFALIPTILAKCTVKEAKPRFQRSVYEFSTNLLTKIAKEEKNHFVTSTLSAWILLVSTSLGAADTTLEEMKQVLKLEDDKCFNKKFLKIASSITSDNKTDVILEMTSNIYVDNELKILKRFIKKVTESGISKIQNISFKNVNSTAMTINDFVSHATHDTINHIVSPEDLENVLMIIIDAVYFKGSWQRRFFEEKTETKPFYNTRGIQIGDVNLMFISSMFKLVVVDEIEARVLELPYGNDTRYSMFIFLPFNDVPLYSVIKNLKLISLSRLNEMFEEHFEEDVIVQIPRFKITSDLSNLKELLVQMGLKSMFTSSEACFSSMSHSPLYVSNFIQKADIEVTEEGTVASAVTKADFSFRSSPYEFIANRPFLFMIVDKNVEVPIFTGAYSKPSLF